MYFDFCIISEFIWRRAAEGPKCNWKNCFLNSDYSENPKELLEQTSKNQNLLVESESDPEWIVSLLFPSLLLTDDQ